MRHWSLLLILICWLAAPAQANVGAAIAWLDARENAAEGVHRSDDLANRVDTNAEALLTAQRLSLAAQFPLVAERAINDVGVGSYALARQARLRLDRGQSAAAQIAALLAQQNADGGFPPAPGLQSEAVTSAYAILALERAGQGGGTPVARAVGYLIASQQTDGGFLSAPGNTGSVFATADVAMAFAQIRDRFNLTVPVTRSIAFLLGRQRPDQSFGAAFESGLAIDALLALRADRTPLLGAVQALTARQRADGSFDGDAFVTAIVARALWQYGQPDVPPSSAGLSGRVLAAATDLPIQGATLALTGTANVNLTSNNQGRLQSTTLSPGPYQARLSFPGMRDVLFALTIQPSRVLDLGDLRMTQGTTPQDDFAIIRGTVTSSESGAPIAAAQLRILAPSSSVASDADGRYQFLQVAPGDITIAVSAEGYSSQQSTLNVVARGLVDLSFALTPQASTINGALIRGTVLHGQTSAPLAGVEIAVTAGAPPVATLTGADGSYSLATAAGALVSIRATKAEFDTVTAQTPLIDNQQLVFSPRLYPTGTTPADGNTARISGRIVNQGNRRPIRNASISATYPGGQRIVVSESNGSFVLSGVNGPTVQLAITADAHEPATLLVPILPLQQRDLGNIGLKPTTVDYYLPDMRIVASTLASSDPDTFALNSQFTVEVANSGNAVVTQDFTLLAFIDANGNGVFDPASEPEVGRVRVDDDVTIGGSVEVDIAVNAQLNFRDAPVAFWVDAENEVIEIDNDNNVGSSLLGCRKTPVPVSQSAVREKWHWRGLSSNPEINSLQQAISVAQLTDDNGDGVIDEHDIPDVVFTAGERLVFEPVRMALVALNGDTGSEIWSRTDFRFSNSSATAIGDIDNDGIAEIIAITDYRNEILAFEHDGTLKWRRLIGGPAVPDPRPLSPRFTADAPIIVNLDGDQEAEIILGRKAFRGLTGELLWEGQHDAGGDGGLPTGLPLQVAFGVASIAADVNLDGVMEVIAGRTLYDFEGNTIWHRGDINPENFVIGPSPPQAQSGYVAVGNFDTDNFAEIVLASGNELWLLEHTGATIWGPRLAPDGAFLGQPVIADIDDDGLPEIVVGSREQLTVFESDGTVKSTSEVEDGFGALGSTLFDLQNDGLYELIGSDETQMQIFDALGGTRLYFTLNSSQTISEFPIVVDVDGDQEAEIIIGGDHYRSLGAATPGVRVFEAAGGAWADAGSVWSSHAFHIDNVREDGTIPLLETPSWLTHNTYRVQRSPLPDPLGMPDFSVGDLRLIDQGPGLPPIVRVRVGNAGPVDAHSPAALTLYRGDPAAGGAVLREIRLDTLRPARFQIIDFGSIPLSGSGQLFAVVDPDDAARECREGNNQRTIAFSATNGLGDLQISTDKLNYRPGETVQVSAAVQNQGGLPANFSVAWLIRDSQNRTTATLTDEVFADVPAGEIRSRTQAWPSTGTLAGSYVVFAQLRNAEGIVIDSATVSFAISGDANGPAGGISVRASRAEYGAAEVPQLLYRAQNLSAGEIIRAPEIQITIAGPGGFNQERTFTPSDLFPGMAVDGELSVDGATASGVYNVTARLRSRLTNVVYATDFTSFGKNVTPTQLIEGFVNVARASLPLGETQTCLFTARNRGSSALLGANLRRRVVEIDSGVEKLSVPFAVDLAPGTDFVTSQAFATLGFTALEHACLLEIGEGTAWRVLDAEPFAIEGLPMPGVIVNPTQGLTTSETGSSANFTVRLATAPSADVTVPLTNTDTTEFSIAPTQLLFTSANWNIERTVTITGVDDDLVDGDQLGTIRVEPAQSSDASYNGLDGPDVAVTNLDNDTFAIRVSPGAIDVSEDGSTATVSFSANAAPTSIVSVPVSSSDPTEFSISASSIRITPENWQTPQSLVVTGVDDELLDGLQTGAIVTAPAESSDARFNGIDPIDVVARNADNESPAIIVTPQSVVTSERGAPQSFVVRLNAEPTAPVRIPLGAVDASEWQVLDLAIVLDASNWQQGRSVIVSPVDDTQIDGDQTGTLVLQSATSSDTRFSGVDPSDVALTNLDDDGPQILVEPTNLIVSETGTSANFTVRLTVAPTAPVQVTLSSSDATEFAVTPVELTFTPGNFGAQTVTVTGIDDSEVDGNIVGQVVTDAAVSSDSRYHGINPPNVVVTNLDDETAQVLVSPPGSIETSEDGSSAIISVQLSTPPNAPVRIAMGNDDAGEWSLDRTELVFPAGIAASQTLTVTGVNDFDIDGDILGVIRLAPAVSDDVRYRGIDPPDVPAINRDNDAPAAILVSPDGVLETTESGSSATFEVRLSTEPMASVRILLSNPDTTEWSLDRSEVLFEPATWRQPRAVVVTGVDDTIIDPDIEGLIGLLPAVSSDGRFNGIDARDVPVINRNNDFIAPAELRVTAVDLSTSEAGDTGRLDIVLNRAPTGAVPVRIAIETADPGEVRPAPEVLEFTAANATTMQSVTLRGMDDFIDDGDQNVELIVRVMPGSDPDFVALPAQRYTAINVDNDSAAVMLSLSGPGSVVEGESTTLGLRLASEPSAPVRIDLQALLRAPGRPGDVDYTLEPLSVTIAPTEWNNVQALRLSTRDNRSVNGDQIINVRIERVISDDPVYPPLTAPDVAVRVIDVGLTGLQAIPVNRGSWLLILLMGLIGLAQFASLRRP